MKIVEDDKVVINIEDEVDKYTFSEFKKARSIIFGRPTDPKAVATKMGIAARATSSTGFANTRIKTFCAR